MKNRKLFSRISTIQFQSCLLVYILLLTCSGCVYIEGCSPREQFQRTVRLSAPLAPGSEFEAETHNGPIYIQGAEVADCNLTAVITARAETKEKAKALAEEVQVLLLPSNNRLTVKIRKPTLLKCASVGVSLDAIVPNQLDLELITHNGAVKISDISGDIDATTHNGKVSASRASGRIEMTTHNGAVICKDVSGDVNLRTHNGKIEADYSKEAESACNVSLVTHNGGIDLTAPPSFSAKVWASTHNGSIRTSLPITITGELSKTNLTGTIGTGEPTGELRLETHNGSINIR